MNPIREQLIKITANIADEPAVTILELEQYINELIGEARVKQIEDDYESFKIHLNNLKSE